MVTRLRGLDARSQVQCMVVAATCTGRTILHGWPQSPRGQVRHQFQCNAMHNLGASDWYDIGVDSSMRSLRVVVHKHRVLAAKDLFFGERSVANNTQRATGCNAQTLRVGAPNPHPA